MLVINTHIVHENITPSRFSDYACGLFAQLYSRKSVKKAIKNGDLLVNGEKAETGRWIKQGDKIELIEPENTQPKEYKLALEVVYEDDFLAVINKPAGIVVNGNRFRTIENALLGNIKRSGQEDALKWPRPVHRLDSQTKGLLVISKTAKAHISLGKQFEDRSIKKMYRAVVKGTPPPQGIIDKPVNGRNAVTGFTLIRSVPSLKNKTLSLMELLPETGRTHQIRIHLAGSGHPVMGDTLYGENGNTLLHKGLFLASVGLTFRHPVTQEKLNIKIEDPPRFRLFMEREEKRWRKYN